MSNGPIYKSEMDGLLSQAVRSVESQYPYPVPLPVPGKEWAYSTVSSSANYPELNVPELLASMEKFKVERETNGAALLDALVDIVNRSPFPVPVWAETLGIPLVQFVATCHREQPPNGYFLNRVAEFFDQFREKPNPTWDELRPLMKTPQPRPKVGG